MGLPKTLLSPWAITQTGLELVISIASRSEFFSEVREQALLAQDGKPLANARSVVNRDGVALIPVNGPLFRHATLMTNVSGASSYETILKDFQAACESPDVEAIVLDIDSPGGEVHGAGELSTAIYQARGQKPIVAYVGGQGASAAYWIASAADKVVADPSATLGSIGVRTALVDDSKAEEMAGKKTVEIVSNQSPYKIVDPAKAADVARVQDTLSSMADVFIGDVARNRGASYSDVLKQYGKGDVLVGEAAVKAGLADEVGSLETLIASLQAASKQRKQRSFAMAMKPKAAVSNGKCSQCDDEIDDEDDMYCAKCSRGMHAAFEREVFALIGAKDRPSAMGILHALKSQAGEIEKLQAKVQALESEKQLAEIAALIDKAPKSKRSELEALGKSHGIEAVKACISILGNHPAPAVQPAADNPAVVDAAADLSAEQLKLLSNMGMSPEKFLKARSEYRQLVNPSSEEK